MSDIDIVELGTRYRDDVTGFTGIATGRIEYLNGCVQAQLTGESKNGLEPVTHWVDHQRLEVVDREYALAEPARTGGPGPTGRPGPQHP